MRPMGQVIYCFVKIISLISVVVILIFPRESTKVLKRLTNLTKVTPNSRTGP